MQSLTIIGAGPGALAPLFAAASSGTLHTVLRGGVTILERSYDIGVGGLNDVTIDSDSPAEAFLDILERSQEPRLRALQAHPVALELKRHVGNAVPLRLAASLIRL
ncbi:MAG: hypothetical protein V4734_08450, partial [Terriglobus sp.]